MALSPGTKLAHYAILSPIGKGGMGEVYRAKDEKLGRDVAIKVLPEEFAKDELRLARFKREAKVLASLNHPNIASIYGLEESDGVKALILELVEGPTLAERIAEGPIPIEEALPIARQMAEALEAGHETGVIHRDLKPGNIKVKEDGTVKVLDYGLAKALEGDAPSETDAELSQSPTLTRQGTQIGVILGTAAYMSPEQAKGKRVDRKADIWAYGAVLFEMLTGKKAFDGADISETLAAVLKTEVDLDSLPTRTPVAIRTLLRRCLERDLLNRLPHVGVARLEIEETQRLPPDTEQDPLGPGTTGLGQPRRARLVGAGILAGAVLTAAAFGVWMGSRSEVSARVVRFAVPPPEGSTFFQGAFAETLTVSPDGQRVAFVARPAGDSRRVWVRPLDSLAARAIPGTEGARYILWAPDGQSIAVLGRDGLKRIDTSGGPPLTLAQSGAEAGAWSSEGVILFRGRDGRIYRVDDAGGEAEAVTELDAERQEISHHPELFLSDGRRFVFRARSSDPSQHGVYLASLDSTSRTPVIDILSNIALANEHLVYQRAGTLMVQPFDEDTGRVTGQAIPFVEGVDYNPATGKGAFSVSPAGVLAYRTGSDATSVLTWFDRTGEPLDRIHDFAGTFFERGSLSADGRSLAVSHRIQGEPADVWLIDLGRGVPTRFTFYAGDDLAPVFSPDGARVVFNSNRRGVRDLYERSSGGTQEASLLYQSPNADRPWAFSPDGTVLLFNSPSKSISDIWALPLEGEREAFPVVSTEFFAGHATFSPDGRWFAYCEGDSGDQIYVQPYPPDGTRVRLSTTSGSSPQWVGTEVFYVSRDDDVMAVDVTNPGQPGIPTKLFAAPATFEHRGILVDSSGTRFLAPVPTAEQQPAQIHVVLNWFEELKSLVSTDN